MEIKTFKDDKLLLKFSRTNYNSLDVEENEDIEIREYVTAAQYLIQRVSELSKIYHTEFISYNELLEDLKEVDEDGMVLP